MKEKIQEAVKIAMKAKDKVRLDTARLILSAIQYEEMQRKVDSLPSDVTVAVLQREINRRKEEIEYSEKAGRAEAVQTLNAEIAFIEEFLPQQMSAGELEKIILELKTTNPALNMGTVMKSLKESYSGQYDGKLASEIAKKILS